MVGEFAIFWSTLPPDFRNLVVSTAASLAAGFLGNKQPELLKPMGVAFEKGLQAFLASLGQPFVGSFGERIVRDVEIVTLLRETMKAPSMADHGQRIKQRLGALGVDGAVLASLDVDQAVREFVERVMDEVRYVPELLPLLQLERMEELICLTKGMPPDLSRLQEEYFGWLRNTYGRIRFKGLSKNPFTLPLSGMYTALNLTEERHGKEKDGAVDDEESAQLAGREGATSSISLGDLIAARFVAITGGPGAGKSTILRYIALAFAENDAQERLGVAEDLFPVLLPVSAYAEFLRNGDSVGAARCSLRDFFSLYFRRRGLPDLEPLICHVAQQGRALFLLDGLDEVIDDGERARIVDAVRDCMIADHEVENRYIITCRTASYNGTSRFEPFAGQEFRHCLVQPFELAQISRFLWTWYHWYETEVNRKRDGVDENAERYRQRMVEVIELDRNIFAIARTPLLLTILVLIEQEGNTLPRNRAELYGKCLTLLAGAWEGIRSEHARAADREYRLGDLRIDDDMIVEMLGPVALSMHRRSAPNIGHGELKRQFAGILDETNRNMRLSRQQADDFLAILGRRSGILQEVAPGVYDFMHQTFREYLIARYLADVAEDYLELLEEVLLKAEWREVVFLFVSSLNKRDASKFVEQIMQRLDAGVANLVLAGDIVVDVGPEKIAPKVVAELIVRLRDAQGGDCSMKEKVSVAESLGWLGVHQGVANIRECFVAIDGGEYDLKEVGTVTLDSFEVCRYPVINLWFEDFVRGNDYGHEGYWSAEGRKWLAYTKVVAPRFWNERRYRCPTSPVVGVCWYEADAFCRWLTATDKEGYLYRLLTEEEWQAVAAGRTQRLYPWGGGEGEVSSNTSEAKVGRISPVGVFSLGNTPEFAISDLGGNVWEWTSSDYHRREQQGDFLFDEKLQRFYEEGDWGRYVKEMENKERGVPVLRGGSWFNDRGFARCAARLRGLPNDRFHRLGFRCARTLLR